MDRNIYRLYESSWGKKRLSFLSPYNELTGFERKVVHPNDNKTGNKFSIFNGEIYGKIHGRNISSWIIRDKIKHGH